MKLTKTLLFAAMAGMLVLSSCGQKNNGLTDVSGELDTDSEVNAIEQSLPEIMVLPSDGTLQRFESLKQTADGVSRDYQKYLLSDKNSKTMISAIQEEFVANDYPLNDLEQTLKQIATRNATDEADDLAKDAKTLLLETATPDIIIELDYSSALDRKTYNSLYNCTLSFIDAYTNKVISTTTVSGINGKDLADAFRQAIQAKMPGITENLQSNFKNVLTKGREVSVRITVENGSNVNLEDESIEGDTYADWINDYMDTHTVKGAYKLKTNTKNEMSYTNVRIPMLNDDGTQYSSYQWARELAKAMRKDLGVKVSNRSQGLANIHLVITGM